MHRTRDILLTALAPAVWGSTYLVTTELLPPGHPLMVAPLRALPAGLLLLLIVRRLPTWSWVGRIAVLGALNFSIFWAMLFVFAAQLPGGVAATVGEIQPLIVLFLSRAMLGTPARPRSLAAAMGGVGGIALLLLTPQARLDLIGIAAGFAGAVSMAGGTVLSRAWRPPVSLLTFTVWQLTAGGILLAVVAIAFEPAMAGVSMINLVGFAYLEVVGAAPPTASGFAVSACSNPPWFRRWDC